MSEWIFGINPVNEALYAMPDRCLRLAAVSSGNRVVQDIIRLAQKKGLQVDISEKSRLDRLSKEGHHQGVCLEVKPFPYKDLDVLLRQDEAPEGPILVLDQVQDPQNVGSMLRTAKSVGCKGVVWGKDRQAQVTPAVIRASSGAALQLPVAKVTNLSRALESLQEAGYWVVGLAGEGDQVLYDLNLTGKIAFVIGAEGHGLRSNVRKHCDALAAIPLPGGFESLNAGIAAAGALLEWVRQSRKADSV